MKAASPALPCFEDHIRAGQQGREIGFQRGPGLPKLVVGDVRMGAGAGFHHHVYAQRDELLHRLRGGGYAHFAVASFFGDREPLEIP